MGAFELYNLEKDKTESTDISKEHPDIFEKMKSDFIQWNASVENSVAGKDYHEGKVISGDPVRHFWVDDPRYESFMNEHADRPEYAGTIRKKKSQSKAN
jgi:hypothetical protein